MALLATVCLAMPAFADAAAQSWRLVKLTGEVRLHVEQTQTPCEFGDDRSWVASGDYRTVLRGGRTRFDRDYAVYSGYFGGPVQGFPMVVRQRREASERVTVSTADFDPVTGDPTCTVREESCSDASERTLRGSRNVGFIPARRLGPVSAVYDSLQDDDFHSCDRGASNPFQDLRADRGPRTPGAYPVVRGRIPFARFRKRIVRFTLQGSVPVHNPSGPRHLTGTISWRISLKLRKSVDRATGCIENGRPSGFVCTKVG